MFSPIDKTCSIRYTWGMRLFKERLAEYGMTYADWIRVLLRQGEVCGICCDPSIAPIDLAIDHDHTQPPDTRGPDKGYFVRGLLCTRCNTMLGTIEDCPMPWAPDCIGGVTWNWRAMEYLDQYEVRKMEYNDQVSVAQEAYDIAEQVWACYCQRRGPAITLQGLRGLAEWATKEQTALIQLKQRKVL